MAYSAQLLTPETNILDTLKPLKPVILKNQSYSHIDEYESSMDNRTDICKTITTICQASVVFQALYQTLTKII